MSWAKFDDRYDDHRKIKRAWRQNRGAVGLHSMAITYCTRHETDGVVDDDWIVERLPARPERQKVLAVLVEHGLFDEVDGGYRVHDFLDHNPSKQARAEVSDAARSAARIRWSKAERSANGNAPSDENGKRSADESAMPTQPNPTQPIKTPPNPPEGEGPIFDPSGETAPPKPLGNRQRELDDWRDQLTEWSAEHFPSAHPDAVASAVRWLEPRGSVTATAVRRLAASDESWAIGLNPGANS